MFTANRWFGSSQDSPLWLIANKLMWWRRLHAQAAAGQWSRFPSDGAGLTAAGRPHSPRLDHVPYNLAGVVGGAALAGGNAEADLRSPDPALANGKGASVERRRALDLLIALL